jgi:hypothetical protein
VLDLVGWAARVWISLCTLNRSDPTIPRESVI